MFYLDIAIAYVFLAQNSDKQCPVFFGIGCSDMGCHIDGFISVIAHTYCVLQEGPVTGRAADVVSAANIAADLSLRLVSPGKKVIIEKFYLPLPPIFKHGSCFHVR